ncbi:MAG TPA: CopG family antitoxin [Bdellovibrionota bacterium]|nr:CopG family antitoxin [Bdellovibrionota bacterium]
MKHPNIEEKEILDSYDRDEWRSVRSLRREKSKYQKYARATLAKDKRVNIRIPSQVLERLRVKAAEEGIPYQTLISSVLYKFVSGRMAEKEKIS